MSRFLQAISLTCCLGSCPDAGLDQESWSGEAWPEAAVVSSVPEAAVVSSVAVNTGGVAFGGAIPKEERGVSPTMLGKGGSCRSRGAGPQALAADDVSFDGRDIAAAESMLGERPPVKCPGGEI